MNTLSLGISPCPNDIYLFSGILLNQIDTGNFQIRPTFQDVETLNRRSLAGDIDIVKVSYAHYPRCAEMYDLLEVGGALGRGVGPLLLINGTEWDCTKEVLVPGEFTTANFLLDFFAQCLLKKRYLPFNTLYETLCDTSGAQGVVINEKRFTYQKDNLTLVQDLGAYWEEKTGYPIPLGAILALKSLGISAEIANWIRESVAWADSHYDQAFALCREYSSDLDDHAIASHIELYVNNYTRNLGTDGKAAVDFFLEQLVGRANSRA